MCLIENELLKHGVFSHIVKQIIKFIVAFKNDETKKVLRNLFLTKIKEEKAKYIEKFLFQQFQSLFKNLWKKTEFSTQSLFFL